MGGSPALGTIGTSAGRVCLLVIAIVTSYANGQENSSAKLLVGTRNIPPFAIKNSDGSWGGLSIELWHEIASELEMKYEFRELTLDELLEKLESKELDVVVAATSVTAAREARIDFSHPFFDAGLGIAVRKNDRTVLLSTLWKVVVWPLLTILFLVLLALLMIGTMIWMAERKRNPEQFGGSWIAGVGHGLWWAAVTMTTVGYGDKTPRTIPGKLIGLTWMLMGVVIISLFTAFVATRLTMEQMQANLSDVSDLAAVKTGAIADTTGADLLQQNGISVRLFDDAQSALTALASKEIEAVVFDRPTLRYLILQNHHDLRVLPTILEHESYAFAFPTGSPLRETVNCKLLEQIESNWWKNSQRRYLGW